MSIQKELDAIKNAVYGKEVRGAIHDGIKKTYDDASKNGNANMEVELARGIYNSLNDRLSSLDLKDEVSKKIDKGDVSVNDINKNLGKLDGTFFSDTFLQLLNGGNLNVTNVLDGSLTEKKYANKSITPEKTNFAEKSFNLFKEYSHGYLGPDGRFAIPSGTNVDRLALIEVKPSTTYTIRKTPSSAFRVGLNSKDKYTIVNSQLVVNDKSKLSITFTTSSTQDFLIVYVGNKSMDNGFGIPSFLQVQEGAEISYWVTSTNDKLDLSKPYQPLDYKHFGIVGDGISDDTDALNNYLLYLKAQGGGVLELPPASTILISKTIYVPSSIIFKGNNATIILKDTYELTRVEYRMESNYKYCFPYIYVRDAKRTHIENLTIKGNLSHTENAHHIGLLFHRSEDCSTDNVNSVETNYNPSLANTVSSLMGYNLCILLSKRITIKGGFFDKGGYECVGIEKSETIIFNHISSNKGWRTSFQIHRGSKDIKLVNSEINQETDTADSGALTIHGGKDFPITEIKISGNVIKSINAKPKRYSYNSAIQIMDESEELVDLPTKGIKITHNSIKGGTTGIYAAAGIVEDIHIIGNTIDINGDSGITLSELLDVAIVSNNTIKSEAGKQIVNNTIGGNTLIDKNIIIND